MLCIMYCIELIRNDFVQQIPMQIAWICIPPIGD